MGKCFEKINIEISDHLNFMLIMNFRSSIRQNFLKMCWSKESKINFHIYFSVALTWRIGQFTLYVVLGMWNVLHQPSKVWHFSRNCILGIERKRSNLVFQELSSILKTHKTLMVHGTLLISTTMSNLISQMFQSEVMIVKHY